MGTKELERVGPIAKRADVPVKQAPEALKQLVKDGLVDQWPTIKAFKINDRGLDALAGIDSRQTQTFQWTWNKRARQA